MAKAFHQIQGYDFNEISPHVEKPVTIMLILTLSISYKWTIHQLNVNNTLTTPLMKSTCNKKKDYTFYQIPLCTSHYLEPYNTQL